MIGIVEHRRAHADITTAERPARDRRARRFSEIGGSSSTPNRRWHSRELADIVEHGRRAAIDRPDDQREFGIADRLQYALLDAEHHLRIGIVVDQPDQEIAPERQPARLRIGDETEVADHSTRRVGAYGPTAGASD